MYKTSSVGEIPFRLAMPREVERDDAVRPGEGPKLGVPERPVRHPAMDEDERGLPRPGRRRRRRFGQLDLTLKTAV